MANHHPSPTMMQMQHQAPPPPPQHRQFSPTQAIADMNEAVWMQIGSVSELMRVPDEAMNAYERALSANPNSTPALNAIGMLLKGREAFDKALDYFRAITAIDQNNGEAWGNLGRLLLLSTVSSFGRFCLLTCATGHCYLMTESLQKAYDAYQQALVNLRDPKDPMLWYGIGILYDRYGSYDYAEEAFSQVMQIEPNFEKANEIYFRLGIIYKQQSKYSNSLDVSCLVPSCIFHS
jgi:glucose repression mediator protein